jgi:fibronectin-binding autotransporter adhesin
MLVDKVGENGTLNKTGAGTLILNGANTHSGVTTLSSGTLALGHTNALQNSTLDTGSSGAQAVSFTAAGTNTYNLGGLQGGDDLALGANRLSVGVNNASTLYSGALGGTGGLTKAGSGTLALSASSTYSGGTLISAGTLLFTNGGSVAGNITNNAALLFNRSDATTVTNAISGTGALTKAGNGTITLSGSNSYAGATLVSGGTLALNSTTGSAAGSTTSVTVGGTATLLISQSNQVNNSATVTLSGGTIQRAAGVSEVFSDLNVTSASIINFGSTAESRFFQFGTVTGGANLTVSNFLLNNEFRFSATDLSAGTAIANSFTFLTSDARNYSFSSGTFTITAVPEPATVIAALGLVGLMLWPVAKRRLMASRGVDA